MTLHGGELYVTDVHMIAYCFVFGSRFVNVARKRPVSRVV